jgi:hypothetical protein
VDDLGDGRFLIRRGHEDPDAGPRISRGDVSPFTAVPGQDAVWNRIMGRDLLPQGDPTTQAEEDAALAELNATPGDEEAEAEGRGEGYFLADPSGGGEWVGDTHSGLPDDEFEFEDMNTRGPDYSQPDPFDSSSPFDSSDPEEAAQAQNIADTEEMLSTWDEERDRRRRWLDGRGRDS